MGDLRLEFKGLTWANVTAAFTLITGFVTGLFTAYRKFWPSRAARKREEADLEEKRAMNAKIERERQLIDLATLQAMRERLRNGEAPSKPRKPRPKPP